MWGFFPIYWKQLPAIGAFYLMTYRLIWTAITCFIYLYFQSKQEQMKIKKVFSSLEQMKLIILSSILISTNWLIFIYAVTSKQVLASSLGYFLSPIFSAAIGYFILKEKISSITKISFLLALIGIIFYIFSIQQLPWISLIIAITFSVYGYIKKKIPLPAMYSLSIEVAIITPLFAIFSLFGDSISNFILTPTLNDHLLLLLTGPLTIFPLYLFTLAAQKLNLSTLGLFQFISPSIQCLSAVLIYQETFSVLHWIAYSLIWTALLLSSLSNFYKKKIITPSFFWK